MLNKQQQEQAHGVLSSVKKLSFYETQEGSFELDRFSGIKYGLQYN
jgi:hypothetical protein